ncbi:hypothetical protein BDQ17DRAFT_1335687 [Cyathus striatus]|nr:hypothetical protein BDQ17DRAFT_1335687 [Cyathus striatus]
MSQDNKCAAGSSKLKVVPLPPCDSFNVDHAQEISPGELLVQYEDAEKKVIKGYIFQNSQYTLDGFIVDAMLTINELQSFEKCRQIPADVMELSRCTSLSSNIKIGDQVKITLEGGKEYLAFVEDIEGENVSLNLVEFPMQVFSQSLELLQKFFKVGDGVRVKSEEHKGRVGMVTTVECNGKIGDKTITFVAFPLGEANHLRIHSSDLDHCNEVQRSTTFQWPDRKSDLPVNSAASYGSEAYQMRVDSYWYQYGKYAWVKCGPLKGTRGILKSISTSNVVQLEVPECLMFSKDLVEYPMKDLYIPGYLYTETTGKDTKPALGVCSTPRWEHDSGIGSQTPTWNPSSMTPHVASVSSDASAELFAFTHHSSARQPTAFDEHWIKRMINADGAIFKGKLLKVIISENAECHFKGLVIGEEVIHEIPPEFVQPSHLTRMPQYVIVFNPANFHEFRNTYQVYMVNRDVTTVMPYKGAYKDRKKRDIPTKDLYPSESIRSSNSSVSLWATEFQKVESTFVIDSTNYFMYMSPVLRRSVHSYSNILNTHHLHSGASDPLSTKCGVPGEELILKINIASMFI